MQVLTANHLIEGDVVYLAGPDLASQGWTKDVHAARLASSDAEAAALLAEGQAAAEANIVVEPYLIEVTRTGERTEPVHYREQFRARGPSVRPDLGKQAGITP